MEGIRATAADGQIRAFAATTRDMVENAKNAHNTSPVATAALGRLMTAAAMMGADLKGEKDLLTLRIEGSGPLGGLLVTANGHGDVKGYAFHPDKKALTLSTVSVRSRITSTDSMILSSKCKTFLSYINGLLLNILFQNFIHSIPHTNQVHRSPQQLF